MTYSNPGDDNGFEPRRPFAFDLRDAIVGALVSGALAVAIIFVIMVIRGNPARSEETGRPSDCPRAWCGCYLEDYLRKRGYVLPRDHTLWRARNWETIGHPAAGPAPGVIAIFARGRKGGHVGIITKVIGPGRIVLLSGNDGDAVRERERSTRGVTQYRRL